MARYWLPLSLLLCFIASLLLRILPPLDQIFTPLGIKFAMNDAYYHMRLVDNLVYNFPHLSYYDPYFVFPGTTVIGGTHFFDWFVAGIAWLAGLGTPTQATIDIVGVYLPPILAALLVIPIYFIGKSIFNKWIGLIGSLLIAIAPGEFLGRSILGAADHHVAEVLLSAITIMFFVLSIKAVSIRRIAIFSVLSGIFLGVYLQTWSGGLLFIVIIELYIITQIIINHLRRMSSLRTAIIATIVVTLATLLNYSNLLSHEVLLVLGLSVVAPALLCIVSWFMYRQRWHPVIFPVVVVVSCLLFVFVVCQVYPSIIDYLNMLLPSGATAATTTELQPMLYPKGYLTLDALLSNFNTMIILAIVAWIVIVVVVLKQKCKETTRTLLLIWSICTIVLMLNQMRYAYYAVVPLCLLSGCTIYYGYVGMTKLNIYKNTKHNRLLGRFLLCCTAAIVLFLVAVPLNVSTALQTAKSVSYAPSDAWQSALLWMRDNTPEPFQGNSIYNDYIQLSKDNKPPIPDYTVTSWWDYGYWITRIGHRVPNANPAQNVDAVKRVADLFLSERDEYQGQVEALKSKYIILDCSTALNKFYAIVSWEDKDSSKYFGYYKVPDKDGYKTILLFYPAYYETLVSRLYNFDGKAVVPNRTVVITYRGSDVLEAKEFKDYRKAQEYIDWNPNTRIVSADPRVSPVPLDAVDYDLVYESDEMVNGSAEVKIFEYTGVK